MTTTEDAAGTSKGALRERARVLIEEYILGVHDTPRSIALGVALGFFIGATPTLGFQIIIYVTIATIIRVNKVSGILPVFISNPVTAVPLYFANWKLGNLITGGSESTEHLAMRAIARIADPETPLSYILQRLLDLDTWGRVWWLVVELWVGSAAVGLVLGVIFYFVSYRAVVLYRLRKGVKRMKRGASSAL